jgi:hypothetical protein
MIQNRKNKPDASENKSVKRELELKVINRILDRRYEVLIELS